MIEIIEFGKVRLESTWYIGVHITKKEDNIILKDTSWFLQAYFFYLKGIFVYLLDVSDTIHDKLLSFFKLAADKDQLGVEQIETDKICALVG